MKFQGDMLNFCDFIQVFVFTRNHHLKYMYSFAHESLHIRQKYNCTDTPLHIDECLHKHINACPQTYAHNYVRTYEHSLSWTRKDKVSSCFYQKQKMDRLCVCGWVGGCHSLTVEITFVCAFRCSDLVGATSLLSNLVRLNA